MRWRLWLLRPGAGGLSWAQGPDPLKLWGPPGWPRMWRRGWSGANLSVVSPWGRGCSARGMGGKCSRGGTHNSTALSGSRGSGWRLDGGGSSWVGAAGRGRGGTVHSGPESASSAGLHHVRAREGEKMEGGGGDGGGANERSWPINGLKCLLNGWFKKILET